jgi:hypothetical protein
MIRSFGVQAALFLFFFYTGGLVAEFTETGKKEKKAAYFSAVFLFALISFSLSVYAQRLIDIPFKTKLIRFEFAQFRLMPLVLFVGAVVSLKNLKEDFKKNVSYLTILCTAFALVMRILLKVEPFTMGFALAVPCVIAYYIFIADMLPSLMSKRFKNAQVLYYYRMALVIFSVVFIYSFLQYSVSRYSLRKLDMVTDRGRMICVNDARSRLYWQIVNYIKENVPEDASLAVFPEGVGINYFTHRDSPLRYYTFIPNEIRAVGERNMIKELEKHDMDYIVVLNRLTLWLGYPYFGIDYAEELDSWIKSNYKPVKRFGPMPFTTTEFGAAVYERKAK